MQAPGKQPGKEVYRGLVNTLAGCYARVADLLWGWRHRRNTMPITLPAGTGTGARPASKAETYMVCLECKRHLAYDWGEGFNSMGGGRTAQSGRAARDCSEKTS